MTRARGQIRRGAMVAGRAPLRVKLENCEPRLKDPSLDTSLRLRRRLPLLLGCLFLLVMTGVQGFYAIELNRLYYTHHGPIYDSVSYLNEFARVMGTTRDHGPAAGLREAFSSPTVTLPYVEAVMLGLITKPARALGVWLQSVWMLALACSVFFYLHRRRGLHPAPAAVFSLPFISFASVYWHAGGLSDFRMDLSLYLFLALTGVWLLTALESTARWPWLLAALAAVLTVAARSTGAAYLAAIFVPVIALEYWRAPESRRSIRGNLLWFGLPALLVMAVYYAPRLGALHHYYFVWGKDPTAGLPLSESIRHLRLGLHHLGAPLKLTLGLALAARLLVRLRQRGWLRTARTADWRLVWIAAAPGLLLAASGAGLNAMVSLPMVFGAILFCLAPFRGRHPFRHLTAAAAAVCILLAGSVLLNAALGVARHRYEPGKAGEMTAFRRAAELLRSDARQQGNNHAAFASTTVHCFATVFFANALLYEYAGRPVDGAIELPDGFRVSTPQQGRFQLLVPLDWENLPGAGDDEKYGGLVSLALAELDYIFLPDEPSISYLEARVSHNLQNLKVRELRRRLLATERWTPVAEPLVFAPGEEVLRLYRKQPAGLTAAAVLPAPQDRRD